MQENNMTMTLISTKHIFNVLSLSCPWRKKISFGVPFIFPAVAKSGISSLQFSLRNAFDHRIKYILLFYIILSSY